MNPIFTAGAILFLVATSGAFAAEKPDKVDTLNFEGDVIEGQKKAPDIFMQTTAERPALDSVLYQRKDFNDFHKVDSMRRPRLSDPPKREQKKP